MNYGSCEDDVDAAGWVLGALSDDEAQRFAVHLATCASCRAEAARLTEASDRLFEAVPILTPPVELHERVVASVHSEADLVEPAGLDAAPEQTGRRFRVPRRRSRLVAAAAALVTGLAAVVGLAVLPASHESPVRMVAGVVTPAGGARARAVMRVGPRTATLSVTRLAPAPPGRLYQAWVIRRDSKVIPTGALFSVPRSGDVQVLFPALGDVIEVIVTAEPPGGSRVPTPPPVVLVQLTGHPVRHAPSS